MPLHVPVMKDEVISYLRIKRGGFYIDCTVGGGGHSEAILESSSPDGRLIGMDRDASALALADQRLKEKYHGRYRLFKTDFKNFSRFIEPAQKGKADGILADLGVSSIQLKDPERGFSFMTSGPLDMRMDREEAERACDLLGRLTESELASVIATYGEERFAGRIARAIVSERRVMPILTTDRLSGLIQKAVPGSYRHGRIHPATRTFQALRIALNRELEGLYEFIQEIFTYLAVGGRLAVISFHSLEDRIVKRSFLALIDRKFRGPGFQWTRKPIRPGDAELKFNPASRSAKMRVIERRA